MSAKCNGQYDTLVCVVAYRQAQLYQKMQMTPVSFYSNSDQMLKMFIIFLI